MKVLRNFLLETHVVQDLGKLAIRLLFGLSLAMNHGWPTFSGALEGVTGFPDPIGLGSQLSMFLAGSAELIFALFVVAGFATRIALIPILCNFGVAFFVFHAADPFGEKEMAFLYLSAFIGITLLGPGKFSLDYVLFNKPNPKQRHEEITI